jgi:hypothetical protein
VVTAAHCLYKDGELVAANSLSILLGLHDRSKKSEPNRCCEIFSLFDFSFPGSKYRWTRSLSTKTTLQLVKKSMT